MEAKRIYPSTQLVVALDAKVLKVYLWILSWSARGDVKYYPKQFAKACKMEEDEVDRCIQSLINVKLVDVSRIDQIWILTPNAEQNQKYYDIPLSKVIEGNGIMMADNAEWKNERHSSPSFDDMSDDEMKKMLMMIQARLNERKEVKKIVTVPSSREDDVVDDLPF